MPADIAVTRGATSVRPLNILLWCVQALLGFVFAGAARAKLTGDAEMVALFSAIGAGQWFRYVTGVLELTGVVLIMVPKTARIGAALLATIMVGAIATHLLVLAVSPAAPLVLLLLAGFVAWGRRYRPGS